MDELYRAGAFTVMEVEQVAASAGLPPTNGAIAPANDMTANPVKSFIFLEPPEIRAPTVPDLCCGSE
jgi:hypothetical protein